MTVRVAIAHRSTFIRDVVRLQGAARSVVVVGETSRPVDLVELCESERPDVAVLDATFEDGTGIESLLAGVQETGTRVLVMGGDPSPEGLTRVLLHGASGYLEDEASLEQVVEAIGAVATGGSVLSPSATATILEQWRRLREPGAPRTAVGKLTAREHDVVVAMADGLAAKAIARRLGVAVKTVESHKFRIFEKLGVHSQAQAVSMAITHGLLAGRDRELRPAPASGRGGFAGSERS